MHTINDLRDLGKYGIVTLTGEACNLAYRILFDLTERGRDIVCNALALNRESLKDSWNGGSTNDPHVASILLTPNQVFDIGVFALLDAGCHTVLRCDKLRVLGLEAGESIVDKGGIRSDDPTQWDTKWWLTSDGTEHSANHLGIQRVFKPVMSHPHQAGSFSNQHAMSGRNA